MSPSPRGEVSDVHPSFQDEVARLSAAPEVRSAFNWFRVQEPNSPWWHRRWLASPAHLSAKARGPRGWPSAFVNSLRSMTIPHRRRGNVLGIHPGWVRQTSALSAPHRHSFFPRAPPPDIRQRGVPLFGPVFPTPVPARRPARNRRASVRSYACHAMRRHSSYGVLGRGRGRSARYAAFSPRAGRIRCAQQPDSRRAGSDTIVPGAAAIA